MNPLYMLSKAAHLCICICAFVINCTRICVHYMYCRLLHQYHYLYRGSKLFFCIFSNTCMGLGINTISLLEIRSEGLKWNNIFTSISLDDNFNMGYVYLMLIVDSIVYMLIAWLACNIYIVVSIHTKKVASHITAS